MFKKEFLINVLWALLALISFAIVSTMDANDRELMEGNQRHCGWVLVDGGAIQDCGEGNE